MKPSIQLISDIHTEFQRDSSGKTFVESLKGPSEPDVLVVAGDLTTQPNIATVLRVLSQNFKNIVYVYGNHEHYSPVHTFDRNIDLLYNRIPKILKHIKNVHLLYNSSVEIMGQRFIGSTGWFPNPDDGTVLKFDLRRMKAGMSDFSCIPGFEPWVYQEHEKTKNYLLNNVTKDDIVVTHHLPTYSNVDAQWQGHPLNPFFVSSMDDVINSCRPKMWVYGHTHTSNQKMIGDTMCVCNPFGYSQYENPNFSSHYLLPSN